MNIKELVLGALKNNSNPIFGNLIQMAENNDIEGLEKFARNFCKERNCDFDKEIQNFQNMFMNKKK